MLRTGANPVILGVPRSAPELHRQQINSQTMIDVNHYITSDIIYFLEITRCNVMIFV